MAGGDDGTNGGASGNGAFDLGIPELLELFVEGEMEIEGRMPYSSNATYLVTMTQELDSGKTRRHRAIYKPGRGERPRKRCQEESGGSSVDRWSKLQLEPYCPSRGEVGGRHAPVHCRRERQENPTDSSPSKELGFAGRAG